MQYLKQTNFILKEIVVYDQYDLYNKEIFP